ncbi:DUF2946 domain-containing protein [Niveispirillum sp. SYP-B3756]|uniref:DUF2946 family protein n=1 Tax=Niveispirillum sp. SYP-B3756 TaxID=2662178 RepID=UPI001290D9A8|nr:DUF2946 family protein [Niveispirillum sp. SYP-B3756]MQP65033.1 DUF2946 domain-containing protein [Niveispirillum sp. SYP-B3756]
MTGGIRRHRTAIPGWARRLALAGSFLACFALLLNLLVWSLYAPAMAAGITTPICAAPAAKALDGKTQGHIDLGARHCPLGLLAAGLAAAPAALPVPLPTLLQAVGLRLETKRISAPPRFAAWDARAPPALA